jgi:hypothetical protein
VEEAANIWRGDGLRHPTVDVAGVTPDVFPMDVFVLRPGPARELAALWKSERVYRNAYRPVHT